MNPRYMVVLVVRRMTRFRSEQPGGSGPTFFQQNLFLSHIYIVFSERQISSSYGVLSFSRYAYNRDDTQLSSIQYTLTPSMSYDPL